MVTEDDSVMESGEEGESSLSTPLSVMFSPVSQSTETGGMFS